MNVAQAVPKPTGETSRLLVAGDTHGNLEWIGTLAKLARRLGCQGIVQLGDFGMWPDPKMLRSGLDPQPNERWIDAVANRLAQHNVWLAYLDGNHDFHPGFRKRYPALDNGMRPIRDRIITWLDRGSVWKWAGVRFGALGGAISIDRKARHGYPNGGNIGTAWWPTEAITADQVEALIERADDQRLDVLLTHDAPLTVNVPGITELADRTLQADADSNRAWVMYAAQQTRPRLLIHGHYHRRYSSLFDDTRVEGIASDQEAHQHGASWVVLELPTLGLIHEP